MVHAFWNSWTPRAPEALAARRARSSGVGGYSVSVSPTRLAGPALVAMLAAVALSACSADQVSPPSSGTSSNSAASSASATVPPPSPSSSPAPQPSRSSAEVATVDVVIVTLDVVDGAVEATGMVPEVVESGGTCTLTLSGPGDTVIVTGPGEPGTVSTYCGLLTFPAARLTSGQWDAVISYQSAVSAGSSQSQAVTLP